MITGPFNIDDPNPKGATVTSSHSLSTWAGHTEHPCSPRAAASSASWRTTTTTTTGSYNDPENDDNRPVGNTGFGNYIWVEHQDGSFVVYFHNRYHTAQVSVGDKVRRGQQLAETGSTGNAGGPHVHFEPFHIPSGKLSGKQVLDVRTASRPSSGRPPTPCSTPATSHATTTPSSRRTSSRRASLERRPVS